MTISTRSSFAHFALALLCIHTLLLTSCSTPLTREVDTRDEKEILRQGIQELDASNGVQLSEARFLAFLYFERYNGLCGAAKLARQTADEWIFDTLVGYGGTEGPPINIHKITGTIRQKGHPTSSPPWTDLLEYVKDHYKY